MSNELVKSITQKDGKAELRVYRRSDGLFTFEEWKLIPHYDAELAQELQDFSTVWMPVDRELGLYDSLENAEREARAIIPWLAE